MIRSLRMICGIALFAVSAASLPAQEPLEPSGAPFDSEEPEAKRQLVEIRTLESIPDLKYAEEVLTPEDCGQVGVLSCPSGAANGTITAADCQFTDLTRYDVYRFSGIAGQQVTINMTSPGPTTSVDPFLLLYNPSGIEVARDDDGGNGLNALIVFTLNATGTWEIRANHSDFFGQTSGPYSLTLACTGGGPSACTPSATSLCLSGGRFRVQTTWRTSQGTSGVGNAIPLTADSGYFWFFDAGNIEVVTKVLNACSFSNRIWVFSAGLTNVEVVMTVTDTRNGSFKTYTNPLNAAYQPIQDVQAFATCP